jgi:hypothetical protein
MTGDSVPEYQQSIKLTLGEPEAIDAGSGHADVSAPMRLGSVGLGTSNLNKARAEQAIVRN